MELSKFYKLKDSLETFSFEKNFKPLSGTLYYFSFLGNIFLILLSFFFIKDISDKIPTFFTGQYILFYLFIILFMTGYELFKRFAFEQLTINILRVKHFSSNILLGSVVCLGLIIGSFYLALNGAERLVDNTVTIEKVADINYKKEQDSIFYYFDKQIKLNQNQIQKLYSNDSDGILASREQKSLNVFQNNIKKLDSAKNASIKIIETKYSTKSTKEIERAKQNNFAFVFLTFSLELVILIGVGFNSYYTWNSYTDMKKILTDPKYKKLELNLNLLKLYYQNGRKKEGDPVMPTTRFRDLVSNSKLQCSYKDISEFVSLCDELEISTGKKKNKTLTSPYEKAKDLLQSQDLN